MEETIEWLCDRPYYEDQITAHRRDPASEAVTRPVTLEDRLASALADRGIDELYAHQHAAIEAVRDGRDVVLATPTASGKSLAYTVPAFERALDRRATTLYIAPQVALLEDQYDSFSTLADKLGFASGVRVARYTGRQSQSEKQTVRERQPTVLCCTPDMLHAAILPHARRLWEWFFDRLETIVVDEIHEYRGVFGSQVGGVLRRLLRLCRTFETTPDVVCCSATIANPADHAATITGRNDTAFVVVERDASPSGTKHWLLWNPPETDGSGWGDGRRRSRHTEARRLFVDLVTAGHQTLVFTSARQVAERYADDAATAVGAGDDGYDAGSVAAYHGALSDGRRRDIEADLAAGDLRGVWSTNALELGVDVGGLDVVILDGYPGTRMQTFQRGGRAGRGRDPSLVVLVGGTDQLDQYIMRNPDRLFAADPEKAVSNPSNESILPSQLRFAADEAWLAPDDAEVFGPAFEPTVQSLTEAGDLDRRETDAGTRWLSAGLFSQYEYGLRAIDERQIQLRGPGGESLGSLSLGDALRDVHPGAIYHHQGQTYEVSTLDLDAGVADLRSTWADYYTRVQHDKSITVDDDRASRSVSTHDDLSVHLADVTRRKQITGFKRFDSDSGTVIDTQPLDLPETSLTTTALYFSIPSPAATELRSAGDLPGAIHAAEHAMIGLLPTTVLCDRRDVGGLSTPLHPHTDASTIFIYDGYPGGVGLARGAYDEIEALFERTLSMLHACSCADGCPACVQSPHCGNGNDPLNKDLAVTLLERFV